MKNNLDQYFQSFLFRKETFPQLLEVLMGPRGSQNNCFQREMFRKSMSRFPRNHPLLSLMVSRFRVSQVKTSLFLLITEPGLWASRLRAAENCRQRVRCQKPLGHFHSVSSFPPLAGRRGVCSQTATCTTFHYVESHRFNQNETKGSVEVLGPEKISFLIHYLVNPLHHSKNQIPQLSTQEV